MAYNPFDDVIEQDPAYMANGGMTNKPYRAGPAYQERITKPAVQEDIARGSETMANIVRGVPNFFGDVIAHTFGIIAENMVNPEAAERGRQKFANIKEASKMFGKVPGQLTQSDKTFYEQRTGKKIEQLDFVEGINMPLDFILSDARAGSYEIRAGKNFTDLDGTKQLGVALLPIEFWFGGAGARKGAMKGAEEFKKQYANKKIVEVINDPKIAAEYPEVIAEMKSTYPMLVIGRGVDEGRIALAPEKGQGLSPSSRVNLGLGAAARQEKLFGSYRPVLDEYLQSNDIINGNTFLDFLREKNIPLNVATDDQGNPLNKKSAINHVKKALKFLGDEKQINLVGGKYKPWMKEAEEIIKKSDEPLFPYEIKALLNEKGLDANAEKISNWIKSGENVQDKDIVGKIKEGSIVDINRDKQVKELTKFINDLENNPDPDARNKGIKEYKIKKADGTEVNLFNVYSSLAQERSPKLMEDLGRENFNKLKQLTMKPDGIIEDSFQNYIPRPQKGYDDDFKIGIKKITESFRDGTFGRFPNFEGLMEKYGILKKTDPNYNPKTQRDNLKNLINTLEMLDTKVEKEAYKQIYNKSVEISEYTTKKYRDTIMSSPELQQRLLSEYRKFDPDADLEKAITMTSRAFGGHLSHVYRISDFAGKGKEFKKGMKGLGTVSQLVRSNFGIENLALQNTAENVVDTSIAAIRNALSKNDMKLVNKHLDKIKKYDELMTEKGMAAYRRLDKKNLTPQVIELINIALNKNAAGTIKKAGVEDNIQKQFNDIFIGSETPQTTQEQFMRFDNLMNYFLENPDELKVSLQNPISKQDVIDTFPETPYIRKGFLNLSGKKLRDATGFQQGGPVRMAIGGNPLENINQQQFTPDPAIDDDFFQQAVESENLLAFNPSKIFKVFGEVKAVDTPKKKIQTDAPSGPPGSTLPTTQEVQPSDFAFKSFTLEKIVSPNAPKAAQPSDWSKFLLGGNPVPEAELRDTGLEQFLKDYEKYYPNQRITQEQLVDYYETSPMGNLSIKVKEADPIPFTEDQTKMIQSAGQPRHRNAGNQPLDEVGKQYREIVVTAGPLPGEKKPFISSGHFSEENVIGFTRVADYDTATGQKVAVIQELQTDMLTKVRKEQERVKALFARIEKVKERANQLLQSPNDYDRQQGENLLNSINNAISEKQLKMLQDNPNLIKPFPNEAAKGLIPQYAEEIDILQNQIDAAVKSDITARKPETQFVIKSIADKQQEVLDNLLDLNRAGELDRDLAKIQVPGASQSEDIAAFGETADPISSYYGGTKELEIFPAIPFNKQADYVDLLVKSTIKDAESKGIQKVAIMPAEKVNRRWGKDPDGPEGKKFKNLYDKVVKQQMQNIAKKYGATFQVEQIVDPTKATKGLRFFNRDVDGGLKLNKEDVARRTTTESEEGIDEFYNEQMRKFVSGGGYQDKDVVLTREVAPGQFQDFYVRADDDSINFVPLGEGETINDALIVIEEFNPSLVDMFVLTMPDEAADKPFFLFKKKDGGSIAKDSLVSITDIFGEYGR